jgi:ubiquinone biosynthesis protein COQ9
MALALLPTNISDSIFHLSLLVDEICFQAHQRDTDIDWYLKRGVIGAIYSATEFYWLADDSEGYQDTWEFLDNRLNDALFLKSIWDSIWTK